MPGLLHLTECDGVLQDTEVHVWHADLQMPLDQIESLYRLLDPEEQARASRFRVRTPRDEFVVSHAFVRLALAKYLEIDPRDVHFQAGENGKPEIADGDNLRFNLSHTHGAAVFAVARQRPVGVDIERIRDDTEAMELAERFFSPAEVDWLRSQPVSARVAAFFTCWTGKEAYMKARGTGLSAPLARFSVIPHPGNEEMRLEVLDAPEQSASWSIRQLDLETNLRCALAVQNGKELIVRVRKWPWSRAGM